MELQHPLEGLFKSRIDELNELIGGQLRVARVYLSLLEIVNFCWLVALIIVLGVGRGKQTPYLQGVEVSSAITFSRLLADLRISSSLSSSSSS